MRFLPVIVAAGGMVCELAIGKTCREVFKITREVIVEHLEGLPEESTHCALLASNTLKEASARKKCIKQVTMTHWG